MSYFIIGTIALYLLATLEYVLYKDYARAVLSFLYACSNAIAFVFVR